MNNKVCINCGKVHPTKVDICWNCGSMKFKPMQEVKADMKKVNAPAAASSSDSSAPAADEGKKKGKKKKDESDEG